MGKEFPFSVIELRKDVHLALKSSAELFCDTADLDFNTLKGLLYAKEASKVVYRDVFKKKKDSLPFQIAGNNVELLFLKQTQESKKSAFDIETLLVQEDVHIEYADQFQLFAHHALYRKQNASKEFQGIITAYPQDEKSQCQLTHGEDIVYADMIDLNMILSRLSLVHPKGKLRSTLLPKVQKEPMRFSADRLIWDHVNHTLALSGHIYIEEETLGTLAASEELQLLHALVKGKPQLKAIHAQGPTTLIYRDPSSEGLHKLISYGKMDIDRTHLLATLESPEKDGRVPVEKQIYYEEEEIGVFADKAVLEYTETDDALRPVSLHLKGNIRLFSHDPKQPPRCGIADRLNYSLTTRTLILAANPGNKVLFWDESQGLRMSASEVHITYDTDAKQHTVKGIGKVQLSLTAEEQQHIKQIFPYYKVLAHE
jgi:lipopolysaccharide export system protein LptA